MSKEELIERYIPLVDYEQGRIVPTQRDNANKCASIAIQYIICILQQLIDNNSTGMEGGDYYTTSAVSVDDIMAKINELNRSFFESWDKPSEHRAVWFIKQAIKDAKI